MPDFRTFAGAILCSVTLLTWPSIARSSDMYRYTNDQGNTVIDYRIPAEYAAQGYEVLNSKGIVIDVIERELTEQELARASEQDKLAHSDALEKERLRKWDESLLLRYSSIEDIEAARERALRDLRIRVSILKSNTRSLKHQVENYQAVAADIERSGGTVDAQRVTAIEHLQREIGATERTMGDREVELRSVAKEFQKDIDRFSMLLELVELRRNFVANKQQ